MKIISLMRLGCAITALAAIPSMAIAQDQDVLIMKRGISQPRAVGGGLKPVEGADLNLPHWEVGSWISGPPACSSTTTQTRERACINNGAKIPDEQCAVPVPSKTQTFNDTRACSYSWVMAPAGPWAAQCANTTRPVSVTCARQGGNTVADVYCSGQTKPTTESGFNAAGCATQWAYGEYGAWSSTCSTSATRDRNITCEQIQPTKTVTVDNSQCDQATKGPGQETIGIYSGCAAAWKYSPWGYNGVDGAASSTCSAAPQQTRTASCVKLTAAGEEVRPVAECGAKEPLTQNAQANYAGCSFAWNPGTWSAWSSTCSGAANATRTRTNQCVRSDGTNFPDSSCDSITLNKGRDEFAPNNTDCGGLLNNNSFDTGYTSWNVSGGTATITADARTGAGAASLVSASIDQTISAVYPANSKVTVSFWCKGTSSNSPKLILFLGAARTDYPFTCTGGTYINRSLTVTAASANAPIKVWFAFPTVPGTMILDDVNLSITP